jgi:hypothetical protein
MSVYIVGHKAKTVAGPRLVFGTPPKEWNLPSEAIAEAQRLAGMSPEKEFFVFRAIAVAVASPPPPPPVKVTEL